MKMQMLLLQIQNLFSQDNTPTPVHMSKECSVYWPFLSGCGLSYYSVLHETKKVNNPVTMAVKVTETIIVLDHPVELWNSAHCLQTT